MKTKRIYESQYLQKIFLRTLHSLENQKSSELLAKAAIAETALFDSPRVPSKHNLSRNGYTSLLGKGKQKVLRNFRIFSILNYPDYMIWLHS